MDQVALEAVYTAAEAIRKMKGITEATADSDNTSGEVIFRTTTNHEYCLRLEECTD